MELIERWQMYISIHQMKKKGFKVSQIARHLRISRNTVYKYLSMTPDEFKIFMEDMETRNKKLDPFEQDIVQWLRQYPDLSAAQVLDWLKERYGNFMDVAESTVRNYVREIRSTYNIPKCVRMRQYEAVQDPPMGEQMQVDFGETKMRNVQGHQVRLWFITFVLSHSRYKFVLWQDRPFTTRDVIEAHEQAFAYFGGMPKEIVYDQDHLLLTSENYGDLILTHEFAKYVEQRQFRIYMCRKSDPESKGRVENVVKYVKRNFAKHRIFVNVDKLNEECLAWLERTGNANVHHTTKKIPAEVFAVEKQHLRPVHQKIKTQFSFSITRTVRKDNTIWYEGNRYSVPIGTYDGTDKEVGVRVRDDGKLLIYDLESGELLAEHERSMRKGQLIQNNNHKRDRSKGIQDYLEHVASLFPDPVRAQGFLIKIRALKPRYIRDQLQLVEKAVTGVAPQAINQALAYCMKHRLYAATDFADAVNYFSKSQTQSTKTMNQKVEVQLLNDLDSQKIKTKPQLRDLEVYQRILAGGKL
jgi:transposase